MQQLINNLINHFEKQDIDKISSYGLWNGKAGMAIVYCLLMRHTGGEHFSDKASILLDEVSDGIASIGALSFSDGVTGIGWAFEWLKENEFLDINTDEALEEIDDTLYRSIVFSPDENISLQNGTLGKATYITKRYQSINENTSRYRNICLQECLVLLTNDLKAKITGEGGLLANEFITNRNVQDMINSGHALLFLSRFLQLKLNLVTVEDTLYSLTDAVEALLKYYCNGSNEIVTPEFISSLQYLAFCYYMAGNYYGIRTWQQRGSSYMQQLDIMNNFNGSLSDNDKIRKMQINSSLYVKSPEEPQKETIEGLLQTMDIASLPFKLQGGSGMALLSCLSVTEPTLITDWHQLIA
jgi:hypothetical protein